MPLPTATAGTTAATVSGRRAVLALVQNVHFLPFGSSGTSQRTPGLLAAWKGLAGMQGPTQAVACASVHA